MKKYARIFFETHDGTKQCFDFPIAEGNTFVGLMMQIRMQGFAIDGTINAYVPNKRILYAFQIENELPTAGMTKQ